ncbi:MAG: type 3 dihydrofolate reductase [Proteobacteria bacterium]|nr:type 3 dihydrofolate reductase [Pseudomonadota bacterium]
MSGQPQISLIVAMAQNGVIGRNNTLPWHLPGDLQRFKTVTLGKPILMGRRTYESIGRALPGRRNLVLTRDARWSAPGVIVVHCMEEALRAASDAAELVVIGGTELFRQVLPYAQRMYLTHVHADVPGDTYFPDFDSSHWDDVDCHAHPADERHAWPMTFVTLQRRGASATLPMRTPAHPLRQQS